MLLISSYLNFLAGGAAQFTASDLCKGLLEVYSFEIGSQIDLSSMTGGADFITCDSKYDSVSLVVLVDDHCLPKDALSCLFCSFTYKIFVRIIIKLICIS